MPIFIACAQFQVDQLEPADRGRPLYAKSGSCLANILVREVLEYWIGMRIDSLQEQHNLNIVAYRVSGNQESIPNSMPAHFVVSSIMATKSLGQLQCRRRRFLFEVRCFFSYFVPKSECASEGEGRGGENFDIKRAIST